MFKRRRFKRRGGSKSWGGVLKYSTRFPGGNAVTQVPFAQTFFTKLAYYQTLSVINAPTFDLHFFNLNYLFSVDSSGTDAAFASELSAMYGAYVVLAVGYEFTVSNLEATTGVTMIVVPWPVNSQNPTDLSDIEYRAGAKSYMLGPSTSSRSVKTVKGYVNLSSMYGSKVVSEEEFWAFGTLTPPRVMRVFVAVQNNQALTTDYELRTHLTFYVKWFNRSTGGEPNQAFSAFGGPLAPDRSKHIVKLRRLADALEKSMCIPDEEEMKMIEGLEEQTESADEKEEEKSNKACPTCKVMVVD